MPRICIREGPINFLYDEAGVDPDCACLSNFPPLVAMSKSIARRI